MNDRHRQEREQREREAWRLRLAGWTQERIAGEIGVSQQAVSLCLRRIETRLAKEFAAEAYRIKARQAAALWEIYRRSLEEFERSCQDAERCQVVSGRVKATELGLIMALPDLETTTTEGQTGNPALLAAAMKALSEIRAIWCPDTAKQEVSGPAGGPVSIRDVRFNEPIREMVVELQGELPALPEPPAGEGPALQDGA
jgi:predicted transcriptional regulator